MKNFLFIIAAILMVLGCRPGSNCPSPQGNIKMFRHHQIHDFGTAIDTVVEFRRVVDTRKMTFSSEDASSQSMWKIWVEGIEDTLVLFGKSVEMKHYFGVSNESSNLNVELFPEELSSCPEDMAVFTILPNIGIPTIIQAGDYVGHDAYSGEVYTVTIDSFHTFPSQGVIDWSIKNIPSRCFFAFPLTLDVKTFILYIGNQQGRDCVGLRAVGFFDPEANRIRIYYEWKDNGVMHYDRFDGVLQ